MEATGQLRQTVVAACWHRGPISGPLTSQNLSALLRNTASAPEDTDFRCEISCTDGFSLRLVGADEGFESDEEATAAGEDRLQAREEIRVSDHVIRHKTLREEDSSSANSSCSDTDEPSEQGETAAAASRASAAGSCTVQGSDVLFCHTDPDVPCGIVFVVRKSCAVKMDSSLEVIVLKCANEAVAQNVYKTYHEVTRKLKWEKYTNSKRKSDVIRASFRNLNDSLRLRAADCAAMRADAESAGPTTREGAVADASRLWSAAEASGSGSRADSGPRSLPETSEISRILSLSTPGDEDAWGQPETGLWGQLSLQADGWRWWDEEPETGRGSERRGRTRERPVCATPTRYSHNKGPPPPPAAKKHPTNPNLMLVPTKNGLEPYRVITPGETSRGSAVHLYSGEYPPRTSRHDWAQTAKLAQFDANNNSSGGGGRRRPPPPRQPALFWVATGEGGRPLPAVRVRGRSKSPAGRNGRSFELAGALSHAFRELTGAVSSHLKKVGGEPAPAPALKADTVNPKSVMKKRDKVAGSPEIKRVTFSAYSTVQVMD